MCPASSARALASPKALMVFPVMAIAARVVAAMISLMPPPVTFSSSSRVSSCISFISEFILPFIILVSASFLSGLLFLNAIYRLSWSSGRSIAFSKLFESIIAWLISHNCHIKTNVLLTIR